MKRFSTLLAALVLSSPAAQADPGNVAGIAPGLCEYPSICTSGAAFGEYDYFEKWPPEVNGSNRVCLLGGAMFQGTGGVSIAFVNFSVTTPLGVIRGACWYACPGPLLERAEEEFPNPPSIWKNYQAPAKIGKCKSVGPAPIPITPPPPPEGPMLRESAGPNASLPGPAVTNGVSPNPDATTNQNSQ